MAALSIVVGMVLGVAALAPPAEAIEPSASPSEATPVCGTDTVDMVHSATGGAPQYTRMWIPAGGTAQFVADGQLHPTQYVGNGRAEFVMWVRISDPATGTEIWSSWGYAGAGIVWGPPPYPWVPFSDRQLGTWQNNTGQSKNFVVSFSSAPTFAGDDLIWSVDSIISGEGSSNRATPCFPLDPDELLADNAAFENGCWCYAGAADPVNVRTGAFFDDFTDIASIPGRGPDLAMGRSYNSARSSSAGPFGPGWTFNFGMTLTDPDASGLRKVVQENGTVVVFRPDGAGGWEPPARADASLVALAGGGWRFTRNDREIFDFDTAGQLVRVADANGYDLALSYAGGQLATATDDAGRSLTFTWTGTGTAAQISGVTDPSTPPRTVSFGYDATGRLTTVTDVAGGTWHYAYDASNRITSVTKPRQAQLASTPSVINVYDASGRVSSQTDENGGTTTFDYSTADATVVTDPSGHVTRWTFDGFGLPASVTRGYGSATASTWTYTRDEAPRVW